MGNAQQMAKNHPDDTGMGHHQNVALSLPGDDLEGRNHAGGQILEAFSVRRPTIGRILPSALP
jgi:hypothetical protein